MKHVINLDIRRPSKDLVERANATHVGVTGVYAGPRQVMDRAIKPLVRTWRICGPAFTVRSSDPVDLLVGEVAGKYAQPGDVIVVDAAGRMDCAAWGAGMTSAAIVSGCAGVVVDGVTMNTNLLIDKYQLPVYSRGQVARGGVAEKPGSINVPVVCGGVIVNPGDIILADADGVVVLPLDEAEEILKGSTGYGQSRPADASGRPLTYWEMRQSEEKLRALPGIEWRMPSG